MDHLTHTKGGLEQRILCLLASEKHVDAADLDVTLLGRVVIVDGYVENQSEADRVLRIASRIAGKGYVKDQYCGPGATMQRLLQLDVDVVHGGHGSRFGKARLHEIARTYLASKGC